MAVPFSRTLRALDASTRSRRVFFPAALVLAVMAAWTWWAFTARIDTAAGRLSPAALLMRAAGQVRR